MRDSSSVALLFRPTPNRVESGGADDMADCVVASAILVVDQALGSEGGQGEVVQRRSVGGV